QPSGTWCVPRRGSRASRPSSSSTSRRGAPTSARRKSRGQHEQKTDPGRGRGAAWRVVSLSPGGEPGREPELPAAALKKRAVRLRYVRIESRRSRFKVRVKLVLR